MPYSRYYFMYTLYAVLAAYTAYTFLWSRFGLGFTAALQYVLLCLVLIALYYTICSFVIYSNHEVCKDIRQDSSFCHPDNVVRIKNVFYVYFSHN